MNYLFADRLQQAAATLSKVDPALQPVIAAAGLPDIAPHPDYYAALVNSIVGQQLSVKAAAAIKGRLRAHYNDALPTPQAIVTTSFDDLRAVGLSGAKVRYIQDLAEHILDGRVAFNELDDQTNNQIITNLTAVKGLGVWTVQMFLIFCLGRLDVLPTGDLGIRKGVQTLYGLDQLPTPTQVAELARAHNWQPYESVASWYVWRLLDNEPL